MTDYPQTNDKLTERVWRIMQKHRGYDNRVKRDLLTLEVCGQDCMNWLDRGSCQASMISRIASINTRLRILDTWLKENQQELRYEQEALWHG